MMMLYVFVGAAVGSSFGWITTEVAKKLWYQWYTRPRLIRGLEAAIKRGQTNPPLLLDVSTHRQDPERYPGT
jgi:hypothetical protein